MLQTAGHSHRAVVLLRLHLADGLYKAAHIHKLVLLEIVIKITDLVTKLPVIHQLNGLLGLALGLLEGWLIINIVFLVLTTLVQAKWGTEILRQISANPLTAWLYEHNFLLNTMK